MAVFSLWKLYGNGSKIEYKLFCSKKTAAILLAAVFLLNCLFFFQNIAQQCFDVKVICFFSSVKKRFWGKRRAEHELLFQRIVYAAVDYFQALFGRMGH